VTQEDSTKGHSRGVKKNTRPKKKTRKSKRGRKKKRVTGEGWDGGERLKNSEGVKR